MPLTDPYIIESLRWTTAQHRAAAAALGGVVSMFIEIAHETSDERFSVYCLTIGWLTQRAAHHAHEAMEA